MLTIANVIQLFLQVRQCLKKKIYIYNHLISFILIFNFDLTYIYIQKAALKY